MQGQFKFLGTGASLGVPVVGCGCAVCRSQLPYNQRLRPSALLSVGHKKILIDAGPDFRAQALQHGIEHLHGVIFTHAHHDHTASVDELRIFANGSGKPLPCLLSRATLRDLKIRFYYMLDVERQFHKTAYFAPTVLPAQRGEVNFLGLKIYYDTYLQGGMGVNGYRIGEMAYVTDIKNYGEEIFIFLKGVKILVLGALRPSPSHLHFSVDEAIQFASKVQAKQTWLTHISHEIDHSTIEATLPLGVNLSYDGLEFNFNSAEEI